MDNSWGVFKFLAPQLPSLANTAMWHSLGRTPTSSKWDLRTELTVSVLRNMMTGNPSKPKPISAIQATTLKDPGVKGRTWVATEKISAPSSDQEGVRQAVFKAIEDMKPSDADSLSYTKPDLVDVEVEWTGYRPDASKDERPPDIPEAEKYERLMSETTRTSETTILYFHGGAYYLCDPSTHRLACSRLAKESRGRVCSVRYRLAPQTAFPGQLLDALLVYLSLLYPPADSMHEAVPASNIVFGGDSAGGNLTFALLQLILQINRSPNNATVRFHGQDVEVPLPAGAFANSGWFDISRSMPSIVENLQYDYLPEPHDDDASKLITKDAIWPAQPPRGDLFCDLSLLNHPLVSPMVAESWANAPPMWLSTGQECLRDEIAVVATRAASQGVKVDFEEYEAMPHVFSMLLTSLPTASSCMKSCGDFCRRCVEEPGMGEPRGTYIYAKSGVQEPIALDEISKVAFERARTLAREARERRMKGFASTQRSATSRSTL